jgi:dTDP-4-dehydrorhamnose reductase
MSGAPTRGAAVDASQTILVIGRSGQLATALVAAGGGTVVTVGRPGFDLTEPDAAQWLLDQLRPAAVINAAAYTAVDAAESEPDPAFALNRDGPARLAAACARCAVPLIHVSTDAVFDGAKPTPYIEADRPAPLGVYGASKLAGEQAVLEALPSALVVRTSWVFGPTGNHFIAKLLGWASRQAALTIAGDQRGRPTYAPDLAVALLALARRMAAGGPNAPQGLLHLAGASVLTRAEQARAILRASAMRGGTWASVTPVATVDRPGQARRPLNAVLDCSLAATRHGITLGSFDEDVGATLDRLIGPCLTASDAALPLRNSA